ncbi:glycosyltransferase [Larkinella soli]|uniref:glycosyltransferase n=1 Tax=Larkinella soli TaxID=1770527 RepID=UPI001E2A6F03|nr:glycosyltransferase [Larkinella soli]
MNSSGREIRVLHITGSMDPVSGGPCQGIRTSTPVLETMGVYREVVCFDEPNAAYLGKDSFPVHALGVKPNSWHYSPKLLPWLKSNMDRFDVLVSNGIWLYHSNAVRGIIHQLKNARSAEKPLKWFVMPHGMLDPYFQRAPDRKLKAIRNWLYWQLLEQKVVRESDGLLFTCETELLRARETFRPYQPKREINVGYGIEMPLGFAPVMKEAFLAKCPEVNGKPYFLFLSRIHPKKGVDLLIDAYINLANKVAASGKELPRLVIAGPGMDTEFGRSLRQLAQADPIGKSNILFPGMLSGHAKLGAFFGCEAFLLPSHQENFGIAVAEALACGKPVLISDQVNIWREITAGGAGFVAEDNFSGTLQLLSRWFELPASEKRKMGDNARNTFAQNFSVKPAAMRFREAIIG